MTNMVDARGLSCPQPVILTRNAIKMTGSGTIQVLVETGTSRDNVSRMARKEGWEVTIQETEDGFEMILSK